ncbi:16S rRNA (cytosine(1402)-N(4))-methyltransferase RsmH [uncultured Thiothrix sp.]|uniref:16S rRNA (cytosine(1402)-N(4))-methyltransferase RsmH n=1 Tax=uncultured Thiothrix sp. TaxID=223185 RepID=UPI00262DEF6D|nr:16S rRNA (cytosine(1402)-N(4))-methyltransferase RsmH [uncultured Thiothrix sp.]
MSTNFAHTTVLLTEAVAALAIKPNGLYIDGTYGRGGHSAKILEQLGSEGRLLAIDKDPAAIQHACEVHQADTRFKIWQGSFRDFPQALAELELETKMDGLLLDLGVSSPQLDEAERGFSFMRDGALDMRMNPEVGLSAQQWLLQADEREIAQVLWLYGEERFSRQIARAIVKVRDTQVLDSTLKLADLIAKAIPKRELGKHPATRSFQAIRIKVNQELDDLEAGLAASLKHLKPDGRLAVISFHSLEDRMVKHFMREHSSPPRLPKGLPIQAIELTAPLRLVGKGLRPSEAEVETNVRARSATLRVAEKV